MLALYRALSVIGGPLLRMLLWLRAQAGKEDPGRLPERMGVAQAGRPAGRLVWVHAASVGEALSALPLIERFLALHSDLRMLITTGTVSSARILAGRLPARAQHQFAPLDRPPWVRRFLDHWRPDMAIWIESELWPNLLMETARRGVPMALVNARLSARSFRRWRLAPRGIATLLGCFRVILARDETSAGFFRQLGAARTSCVGDLKQTAAPLTADAAELALLRAAIGERPLWLAASTHRGEEAAVMQAQQTLRTQFPTLLGMIAPRHAERGAEIAKLLSAGGLSVARRAEHQLPDSGTDIYLADTMGEMGLLYQLSPIAFVGGSLARHGGQNPLEPARLGCAILHGPHIGNFSDSYAALDAAVAAAPVADAATLAAAVAALLSNPGLARAKGEAAQASAAKDGDCLLEEIIKILAPLLRETGP